jgi:hypothetical protein
MKQLTVYGLAFLLVVGTTTALAGDRRHGGHPPGSQHYRGHHGYSYKHYPQHSYYRGHYGRHHYGRYYPSYLGAALIASSLSYSLHHNHNGVACYQSHSTDRYQQQSSSYSEVVGCHRIERLSDGSERRVEVPMSQCR